MEEIWKDIKGYEGMYEISNLGNVKSLKKDKAILLKMRKHSGGYSRVCLSIDNKVKISMYIG